MKCKLCNSETCDILCKDKYRSFLYCKDCGLIFVPDCEHVSLLEEKLRYDNHDNSRSNAGYVNFLEKMVQTVECYGTKDIKILDFGCGKQAVLTCLLNEKGYSCTAYDPLYQQYSALINSQFDIVILCEVIEHLRKLNAELALIKSLINPQSKVIIRTQLYKSTNSILDWWYTKDITHVNFFTKKTIEFAALQIGLKVLHEQSPDIFVLGK